MGRINIGGGRWCSDGTTSEGIGKNKCIQCGRKTNKPSWCSQECADIYNGEAPRRSGNPDAFYLDSPYKKKDPSHDYRSNEEIRVYGE